MSTLDRDRQEPRRRLSAAQRREVIERAALEVFAERGYHGASIDEIARRSGVTPPVVYDHFASKLELHKRLLERTRDELLEMWRVNLGIEGPASERIPRAIDAWARYVEGHPYAARLFFVETTGDPEIEAIHRDVRRQAQDALAGVVGAEGIGGPDARSVEMTTELIRSGLGGLAIWWSEHPDVPRGEIVATAISTLWTGLERGHRPAEADAKRSISRD